MANKFHAIKKQYVSFSQNISQSTQAGSEVAALSMCVPLAVGYQPILGTALMFVAEEHVARL